MLICPQCENLIEFQKDSYKCTKCSEIYNLKHNIFIFTKDIKNSNYNPKSLKLLYNLEQKHFWFVNRKKIIANLFKRFIPKNKSILEIGAGTGNMSLYLKKMGYKNITVSDIYYEGLIYAQEYGLKNLFQFDIRKSPFINHFDVIGMFDVLEHFENDSTILKKVHMILKKKGKIILTVPAHQWLWSSIDAHSGHKRRYSKKELIHKLEENGFKVLQAKYFFFSILPFLFLRSLINSKRDTRGTTEAQTISLLNPFFNSLLFLENIIMHNIQPPAGGSLIVIGVKDDTLQHPGSHRR